MKKYLIIFILIISKFNVSESSENIKYFDDQIKKLEIKYESDVKKIKEFENLEREEILTFIGNIKQAKEFFSSAQSLKAKKEMAFLQLTLNPKKFDSWLLNEKNYENYNLYNSYYEDEKRGYVIVCNDLNPYAFESSSLYHLNSISIEFLNASMQDEGDAKLSVVWGNFDNNDADYNEYTMFYKVYENSFVFYPSRDDLSDLFLINRKNFQIEANPNIDLGQGKTNCFAGHKTDELFLNSNNETNIKEYLINNYKNVHKNLNLVISDIVEKIENNFYLAEYQNKLNNLSSETKNNLANLNSKFEKEKLILSEKKKETELEEKIKAEEKKKKIEEEKIIAEAKKKQEEQEKIKEAEALRLFEEEKKRIAEEKRIASGGFPKCTLVINETNNLNFSPFRCFLTEQTKFNEKISYEGEILNSKKHGKGKLIFLKSPELTLTFEGNFENDILINGILKTEGIYYEGEFNKNLLLHGNGQIHFLNSGEIYVGKFKDGYPHGNGKWIYSDGDEYVGVFNKGEFSDPGREKRFAIREWRKKTPQNCLNWFNYWSIAFDHIEIRYYGDTQAQMEYLVEDMANIRSGYGQNNVIDTCGIELDIRYKKYEDFLKKNRIKVFRWKNYDYIEEGHSKN